LLLDDLVGNREQLIRHCEAERLGGSAVDHEFKLRGLLDGELVRFRALKNFIDIGGSAEERGVEIRGVGQTAGINVLLQRKTGRDSIRIASSAIFCRSP
jgi:hypothetical protein